MNSGNFTADPTFKYNFEVVVLVKVRVQSNTPLTASDVEEYASETHFEVGRMGKGIYASVVEHTVENRAMEVKA